MQAELDARPHTGGGRVPCRAWPVRSLSGRDAAAAESKLPQRYCVSLTDACAGIPLEIHAREVEDGVFERRWSNLTVRFDCGNYSGSFMGLGATGSV